MKRFGFLLLTLLILTSLCYITACEEKDVTTTKLTTTVPGTTTTVPGTTTTVPGTTTTVPGTTTTAPGTTTTAPGTTTTAPGTTTRPSAEDGDNIGKFPDSWKN